MKTLVQRAFALVIVALSVGLVHSARAQSIEFTSAPTTQSVGVNGELWLLANLPTGIYDGLTVELEFPSTTDFPYANFVNATGNADFTFSDTLVGAVRTLRWTHSGVLDLRSGASTRQFLAVFSLANNTFRGTPLAFQARLSGTKDGGAFTPASATTTVTATRSAATYAAAADTAVWGNIENPNVAVGHPDRVGVRRTYRVWLSNGNADFISSFTSTLTLPAGMRYVFHTFTDDAGNPVQTGSTDLPTAFAENATGTTFQLTSTSIGWTRNANVYVTVHVFVPCRLLPIDSSNAAYALSASSTLVTRDWAGVTTSTTRAHPSLVPSSVGQACGTGGGLSLAPLGTSNSGELPVWQLLWSPPIGATRLDEGMVVLTLPPETTAIDPQSTAWSEWTILRCNFAGIEFASLTNQLSLAELENYRASRCRTTFAAGDTHVVYYTNARTLESVASFGGSSHTTSIPSDWRARHGLTVSTHAYFVGAINGTSFGDTLTEATPSADPWEASASQSLPTTLIPSAAHYVDGSTILDSNGGVAGTSFIRPRVGWAGFPPTNSMVTVEVPEGVTINSVAFDNTIVGPGCNAPADKMVWPNLSDRPLVFRLGTPANPYTQPGSCSSGPAIKIGFTVDPTYPFFHEQALPFRSTHTADNQTSQGPTFTANFSVIVAAGQDSRLTVQCDPEGYPAFEARAVNRGRDPIDNGILRFVVPEGAAVMSIVPNAAVADSNATLEVSFDDGQNWSTAGGSGPYTGVTDIRLDGIDIAGGSGAALRPQPGFFVTVDPGLASGTIEGEVTMWSAALGTTTPKFAAYEVGLCPGAVSVLVYFDANTNEMWDDAEEAVGAGHHVKLTPTAGSLSGVETEAVATDAQGWVYFLDVTPGEYDIVYVTGPATDGAWSMSVTEAVLVANDGEAWGVLGLSCVCEDPTLDTCSAAECNTAGACVEVFAEYDTPCNDGQTDAACNTDRCDGEGQCVPMPVETGATCDNPESDNPCSVGGACDGQGACLPVAVEDGTQCGDSADCLDMLCSGGYCAESYVGYDEGSLCTDPAPDNFCLFGVCDGVGACRETFEEDGWECDDPNPDNPCDRGACFGGSCVAEPDNDGGTCDNPNGADPCTEGQCQEGTCAAVEANEGGVCDDPTPLDPCTEGRCQVGVCDLADADDGTACTLEDACAATSECEAGQCVRTSEVACDDGDACTGDYCDDTLGGCAVTEPTCDRIAVAIPIADAVSGAARGHVLCFVTPSPSGGPGTLSCDTGSGTLVQHEGVGACGNTP